MRDEGNCAVVVLLIVITIDTIGIRIDIVIEVAADTRAFVCADVSVGAGMRKL